MAEAPNNRKVLIALLTIVVGMTALAFASVPLYRIFCQQTGYGGTPKIAAKGADRITNRVLTVRFNADVAPNLPWTFKPLQTSIQIRAGELGLAFYQVKNLTNQPLVGIASYNVTPDKAGQYFNKVACFCFQEQIIAPKDTVDLPVQFFIHPDFADDHDCRDLNTITLSYTFFQANDPRIKEILGLPQAK